MKALSTKLWNALVKMLPAEMPALFFYQMLMESPLKTSWCFLLSPKPLITLLHHGYGVPFNSHKLFPWVSHDQMWRITRLIQDRDVWLRNEVD